MSEKKKKKVSANGVDLDKNVSQPCEEKKCAPRGIWHACGSLPSASVFFLPMLNI